MLVLIKSSISARGMSTTKITGVRVNGSDTVSANAVLKVAVEHGVRRSHGGSASNRHRRSNHQRYHHKSAVIELPRDSRDVYSFLYLNPNISQGSGTDGEFKFLGAQSYGGKFLARRTAFEWRCLRRTYR